MVNFTEGAPVREVVVTDDMVVAALDAFRAHGMWAGYVSHGIRGDYGEALRKAVRAAMEVAAGKR